MEKNLYTEMFVDTPQSIERATQMGEYNGQIDCLEHTYTEPRENYLGLVNPKEAAAYDLAYMMAWTRTRAEIIARDGEYRIQ